MTAPHIHHLDSDVLKRRRKLRIWHSPGASDDTPRHVLFQQDGQMAFSDRDDEVPFGTWGLDRHLERLCASGSLPPILVVGIDNSPKRRTEYFPVTDDYKDYERFLVEELAPWVQDKFPTLPGISLMGSSLGGIVSFALSANNPKLFPACACLSPWFEYEDFRYIREHLQHLRQKPPIRVYMDSGIRDWRGLDDGHRGMLMARIELLRLGFTEGDDLDWMVDTWFPSPGDLDNTPVKPERHKELDTNQHNEYHWNRRLERPLRFLFGSAQALS